MSTLHRIISDCPNQISESRVILEDIAEVASRIDFERRMLRNLLLRAQSNKERLQNEISLVGSRKKNMLVRLLIFLQAYNMITQRDSQVMADLGAAARQDSSAMKTIAVVTMAFLPPTFLSVSEVETRKSQCSHISGSI